MAPGTVLNESSIIGTIADAGKSSARPHLHISVIRAPESFSPNRLDWDTINGSEVIRIDPLEVLNLPYSVVDSFS